MKKGITPVIAMIMLLLIVVALAGGFMIWMNRTWGTLAASGEQQTSQATATTGKVLTIDNIDCATNGIVYVRNSGTQNVLESEVSLYVDDVLDGTAVPDFGATNELAPGMTGEIDGTAGSWAVNTVIKVTAPGSTDSSTC
jgi:flagellin-like protein